MLRVKIFYTDTENQIIDICSCTCPVVCKTWTLLAADVRTLEDFHMVNHIAYGKSFQTRLRDHIVDGASSGVDGSNHPKTESSQDIIQSCPRIQLGCGRYVC